LRAMRWRRRWAWARGRCVGSERPTDGLRARSGQARGPLPDGSAGLSVLVPRAGRHRCPGAVLGARHHRRVARDHRRVSGRSRRRSRSSWTGSGSRTRLRRPTVGTEVGAATGMRQPRAIGSTFIRTFPGASRLLLRFEPPHPRCFSDGANRNGARLHRIATARCRSPGLARVSGLVMLARVHWV
jgi:hypothetical protein